MNIRFRLLLSYIAMIIVPVICLGFVFLVLKGTALRDMEDMGRGFGDTFWARGDAVQFSELVYLTESSPDDLRSAAFLQQLDAKLRGTGSGFRVTEGDRILYETPAFNGVKNRRSSHHRDLIEIGDNTFEVDFFAFAYSDGQPGRLYLFSKQSELVDFVRRHGDSLAFTLLIVFALTNVLLTTFMSQSILRPLKRLKRAAEEIREGNLDFKLTSVRKDEFGDVTRAFEEMRRRLHESLVAKLQYEEQRKELLAHISHDLKTPITSIKGYVEGIRDGVANSPEKLERYLDTIYRKATDMDRLIDELFLYSKLDLNRIPFEFAPLDLAALLREMARELRDDAEGMGIEVVVPEEGAPVIVTADAEKIRRVVRNITENAIKHMTADEGEGVRRLTFSWRERAAEVTVIIADTGPGIDPEDLPYIFERFYRADRARNTAMGGSGLGLAIVKGIVEGHGGRVCAQSTPGAGTRLSFTLPKRELADEKDSDRGR